MILNLEDKIHHLREALKKAGHDPDQIVKDAEMDTLAMGIVQQIIDEDENDQKRFLTRVADECGFLITLTPKPPI